MVSILLQAEASREDVLETTAILKCKAEVILRSKMVENFMHGVLFPAMVISQQSLTRRFMSFIRLQISVEEALRVTWDIVSFHFRSISFRTLKFH